MPSLLPVLTATLPRWPRSWLFLLALVSAPSPDQGGAQHPKEQSRPADTRPAARPASRLPANVARGRYALRFARPKPKTKEQAKAEEAVQAGLVWLRDHQDQGGRVGGERFQRHCPQGRECQGKGVSYLDVGLTGLTVLAFLGAGNTTSAGPFKDNVQRGIGWLRRQQLASGLVGTDEAAEFMYCHAIATIALCEAYGLCETEEPELKDAAQRAIRVICKARNPGRVWRYFPRNGDNDTSITGWMTVALVTAEDFGLEIDKPAFIDIIKWLDDMTDAESGEVGYGQVGEGSSRKEKAKDKFPVGKVRALNGVAVLVRALAGENVAASRLAQASVACMMRRLPSPAPDATDMYYWFYGTHAMAQVGGADWDKWQAQFLPIATKMQRQDGHAKGSWDAVDPWSDDGGRVYATTMMVLALEAAWRYARPPAPLSPPRRR